MRFSASHPTSDMSHEQLPLLILVVKLDLLMDMQLVWL